MPIPEISSATLDTLLVESPIHMTEETARWNRLQSLLESHKAWLCITALLYINPIQTVICVIDLFYRKGYQACMDDLAKASISEVEKGN